MTRGKKLRARSTAAGLVSVLTLSLTGCSAGDPPNPDAARATDRSAGDTGATVLTNEDDKLSDAEDSTLDALDDRFERQA